MKLFIGLGLLLLFGGLAASFLVLPSLVLEYGITVVVGGIVAPTGGLVLIGIGLLLRELHRLGARLAPVQPVAEAAAPTDDPAIAMPAHAGEQTPDGQGELFGPAGVEKTDIGQADSGKAAPGSAVPVLAGVVAGAAGVAASRISPFDKIERALEDVLETTRGEARQAEEPGAEETEMADGAGDPAPAEAGIAAADEAEALADGRAFFASDDTSGGGDEEPAASPQEEPAPVSSDEGIVRVYTIGESSFTMYASGIIRAQTPEGALTFATMDELKSYLEKRPATLMAKA